MLDFSSRSSSQREVASFFSTRDCSRPIPSRGTAHAIVRGSASSWQTLMYLVRIPHRKGHSIQRDVWLAETVAWFSVATSTVAPRVGPNGRDLKLLHATQIEQPGRIFVCGVLLLLSRTTISSATIQVAWAEDRALLGSNPSAVPGAKIGGRGDDLSPTPFASPRLAPKR